MRVGRKSPCYFPTDFDILFDFLSLETSRNCRPPPGVLVITLFRFFAENRSRFPIILSKLVHLLTLSGFLRLVLYGILPMR